MGQEDDSKKRKCFTREISMHAIERRGRHVLLRRVCVCACVRVFVCVLREQQQYGGLGHENHTITCIFDMLRSCENLLLY